MLKSSLLVVGTTRSILPNLKTDQSFFRSFLCYFVAVLAKDNICWDRFSRYCSFALHNVNYHLSTLLWITRLCAIHFYLVEECKYRPIWIEIIHEPLMDCSNVSVIALYSTILFTLVVRCPGWRMAVLKCPKSMEMLLKPNARISSSSVLDIPGGRKFVDKSH